MKLQFDRQEMAEALRAICGVAASRTTKPVLRCVRLDVRSDVLLLSATDLELGLRHAVSQVEVDTPGETLVAAETLSKIVSECADETLNIETDESLLHVRGQGSHFQIVTQDPSEFPVVPEMTEEADFTMTRGVMARLMEWTAFAAARESTRYAINGVLWQVEGKQLIMAATDGRRLSLARGALTKVPVSTVPQAIVPGKAMSLFSRLTLSPETVVGVKVSTNQLLLDVGPAFISTALVEGNFPDYEKVVPTDCDRIVKLDTAEFLSALKRASLLTNEESKGVRLSLSEGNMTLSSRAPEEGEATVSVPVQYSGEPMDIGFNPVFLMDPLRVAHTEEISIALKESNRPGLISIGDEFLYVVMPVNLASG